LISQSRGLGDVYKRQKERLAELLKEQETESFNPERLIAIAAEVEKVQSELLSREEEWLEITLALES
jgi:ATP-binding cassette subfamily F protein uup